MIGLEAKIFLKMAFNFLNRLRNQFAQEEVVDQKSPVDEEEGDIDDESGFEFAQGGEEEEEESVDNVDLDPASVSDPNPYDFTNFPLYYFFFRH